MGSFHFSPLWDFDRSLYSPAVVAVAGRHLALNSGRSGHRLLQLSLVGPAVWIRTFTRLTISTCRAEAKSVPAPPIRPVGRPDVAGRKAQPRDTTSGMPGPGEGWPEEIRLLKSRGWGSDRSSWTASCLAATSFPVRSRGSAWDKVTIDFARKPARCTTPSTAIQGRRGVATGK